MVAVDNVTFLEMRPKGHEVTDLEKYRAPPASVIEIMPFHCSCSDDKSVVLTYE